MTAIRFANGKAEQVNTLPSFLTSLYDIFIETIHLGNGVAIVFDSCAEVQHKKPSAFIMGKNRIIYGECYLVGERETDDGFEFCDLPQEVASGNKWYAFAVEGK